LKHCKQLRKLYSQIETQNKKNVPTNKPRTPVIPIQCINVRKVSDKNNLLNAAYLHRPLKSYFVGGLQSGEEYVTKPSQLCNHAILSLRQPVSNRCMHGRNVAGLCDSVIRANVISPRSPRTLRLTYKSFLFVSPAAFT
jgi:hypothetical protein